MAKNKNKNTGSDLDSVLDETKPNGVGVGVYKDDETGRFFLAQLDLYPEGQSAKIVSKKKLTGSKIAAILNGEIELRKLLEKTLKEK